MKLTPVWVVLCQTCCMYLATAFALHASRNVVNSRTEDTTSGDILNTDSINIDHTTRLKLWSSRPKSRREATNVFNKSHRSQLVEKFRTAYTTFHQQLRSFLEQLSERFKQGTPWTLQNIQVIAEVMPLDDLDIVSGNVDNIIKKYFIIQEATLTVLDKIRPVVLADYLEWFRRQSLVLKWRMNIVGFVTLSLGIRDKSGEVLPMDMCRATFADSLRELQEFLELLCQRYKSDVPASFMNVSSIPTIFQTDDSDLLPGCEDQLVKKFCILEHVTTVVLNKSGPFVDEGYLDWFKERSETLQWRMNKVMMSLATLRVCDCSEEIQIVSSGISGSNTGVKDGLNYETLIKLHEVIKELQ